MEAAHRQSGNRAVLFVSFCTVCPVNISDNIGEGFFERSVHRMRQRDRWGHESEMCLAGSRFLRSVAVRHHDDHRLDCAFSDKIVKNLSRTALSKPCFFVAAHAVKQIEHRIASVARCLIARRSVNAHASLHAERRRIIPDFRNSPVVDIVDLIEPRSLAGYEEIVEHRACVAYLEHIGRISYCQPVDNIIVSVHFRIDGLGSESPYAGGVLLHFDYP